MTTGTGPLSGETALTVRAGVWMLGSVASFSAMAVAGRAVSHDLDTFELMFYRSVIGILIVVPFAWFAGTLGQVTLRRMRLQVLRNTSHFIGQNLWFWALTVIPLAQVVALEFTQPIWVLLLAVLFLGERLTVQRIIVVALGFSGALMVARPEFGRIDLGVLAAAGAAMGFAGSAVMTKLLTRSESVTCILFWLVVLQALFGLIMAGRDGEIAWPAPALWPWLAVLGVAGLAAHLCLTRALQLAPASVVVPFDFLRLPILATIGFAFYGETVGGLIVLGAALILGANAINLRGSPAIKPQP